MARNWTENQLRAINEHNSDILVAAAAGSGKTAVLTERVIRMLTNEKNPVDISKLIIVTFTEAAAKELKSRIRTELNKKIAENSSAYLRRQLLNLQSAKISTIHSFCFSVIKDNFALLNLPASLRIADATESDLLYRFTMEHLIDNCYEEEVIGGLPPSDFEWMCDNFLRSRLDEKLSEIFINIYKTVLNSQKRLDLISESVENYEKTANEGFENSIFFIRIKEVITETFTYFTEQYEELFKKYSGDPDFSKKYFPAFSDDLDFMHSVLLVLDQEENKKCISLINGFSPSRLASVSGNPDFKEESADLRNKFKDSVSKIKSFFSYSDEEIRDGAEKCVRIFKILHAFLSEFDRLLCEKKYEKHILDFADLEYYAAKLLWDSEKNEPTQTALDIRANTQQILIDEYQDTNELQDKIFYAISDNNRFMVGDIKQSIYKFRGAVVDIFASYRKKFTETSDGKTIFLSNNFRCSRSVVDFSNEIFSSIFTIDGNFPYTSEDALVYSKPDCFDNDGEVEIALIDPLNEEEISEPVWVAEKIAYLLDHGKNENGEPYTPNDFAILMRSVKSNSEPYENELRARGIPVFNSFEGNFFESPEVQLVVCLLCAIDNPLNDIYFAGAMKSPVFSFTFDELITIRRQSTSKTLYGALVEYRDKTQNEKAHYMLEELEHYRHVSNGMPTDKFIMYLYRRTCLYSLICAPSPDGKTAPVSLKKANLTLLYEYARSFEASSFKGLYNFIRYLLDIIEQKKLLPVAKPGGDDYGVKIMTVHKSKGLEFPVCFLCDCGKHVSAQNKNDFEYSKKYGFGIKIKDESGLIIRKMPFLTALSNDNAELDRQEEMRILYVALTRARQRLFVTGTVKNREKFLNSVYRENVSKPYEIKHSLTFIEYILRSLPSLASSKPYKLTLGSQNVLYPDIEPTQPENDSAVVFEENTAELEKLYKQRFSFVYPYDDISKMPKKVSVSSLYPSYLDETADEFVSIEKSQEPVPFILPDINAEENLAAKRGTASHVFMQFCDFEKTKDLGIISECDRLISLGFIPNEYKELIYENEIEQFFSSDLFKRITASSSVQREYRFNIELPAVLFTSDEEKKSSLSNEFLLVQGVVDCFFENDDGTLTVVDYKTDRLRKGFTEDEQSFILRHKTQLLYYKFALEKITLKKVSDLILYSFSLGKEIKVLF